jgi:hypothetical protein
MIDKRPAAVVRCAGTADIIDSSTSRGGWPAFSIRRWTNIGGTALCDDGVVIDLSHLKESR